MLYGQSEKECEERRHTKYLESYSKGDGRDTGRKIAWRRRSPPSVKHI